MSETRLSTVFAKLHSWVIDRTYDNNKKIYIVNPIFVLLITFKGKYLNTGPKLIKLVMPVTYKWAQ